MNVEKLIRLLRQHDLQEQLDHIIEVLTELRETLVEERVFEQVQGYEARNSERDSDRLNELLQIAWGEEGELE